VTPLDIATWTLLVLSALGTAYLCLATWQVSRFRRPTPEPRGGRGITVLKPLKGEEPGLYESLRSFLETSYQPLQVIFGVRDPEDPARAIVERLISERPDMAIDLVVDERVHGTNPKVSNLLNMLGRARYDRLVISDSDIRVGRGYFEAVSAPLEDPRVGLVTCLYLGRPGRGFWSRMGASWVNHAFLPSVLVGKALGNPSGCFGATLALRRETLDAIGGLHPLRDLLADDYALGAAVRAAGQRVVLSGYLVDMVVGDEKPSTLVAHEVRWLRTIRSIEPLGYAGTVLTHPVVCSTLALLAGGFSPLAFAVLFAAVACRLSMVAFIDARFRLARSAPWEVLFRDFLSFGLFLLGFWGTRVGWRGRTFRIRPDGSILQDGRSRT
jgi:ceramide glucosyltransferase